MSYNKNMSLSNLLDKIKKIPVLKKNEEEELASWFNSNELARPIYEKILIYHNLRLARHIANRFMDRGYELEDLISEAGKDAVKILDLTKSNHELSKEFDQLLKSKVLLSFRKQFIKDNSTYAQLLAKSWVDLINKQKL